jgi:hypothetical protein
VEEMLMSAARRRGSVEDSMMVVFWMGDGVVNSDMKK